MNTEPEFRESMEFWKTVHPGVSLPIDIWYELSDYYFLMDSLRKIIYHSTGGLVSKINTNPEVVCSLIDDHVTDLVAEELQDILGEAGIGIETDDLTYLRDEIVRRLSA